MYFFILTVATRCTFNPYMTSGPVHPYQLNESISNLGVYGILFYFYSIVNRNSCKQTVKTLISGV